MKQYLILALLSISTLLQAQESAKFAEKKQERSQMKKMSSEQIATLKSKKMTLELDLSEEQQSQVYDLIYSEIESKKLNIENRKKESLSQEERYALKSKHLDNMIAHKKAMRSILTDEQYNKWTKFRGKDKRKKLPTDSPFGKRPKN